MRGSTLHVGTDILRRHRRRVAGGVAGTAAGVTPAVVGHHRRMAGGIVRTQRELLTFAITGSGHLHRPGTAVRSAVQNLPGVMHRWDGSRITIHKPS